MNIRYKRMSHFQFLIWSYKYCWNPRLRTTPRDDGWSSNDKHSLEWPMAIIIVRECEMLGSYLLSSLFFQLSRNRYFIRIWSRIRTFHQKNFLPRHKENGHSHHGIPCMQPPSQLNRINMAYNLVQACYLIYRSSSLALFAERLSHATIFPLRTCQALYDYAGLI